MAIVRKNNDRALLLQARGYMLEKWELNLELAKECGGEFAERASHFKQYADAILRSVSNHTQEK